MSQIALANDLVTDDATLSQNNDDCHNSDDRGRPTKIHMMGAGESQRSRMPASLDKTYLLE
jgi:hypothetical protein